MPDNKMTLMEKLERIIFKYLCSETVSYKTIELAIEFLKLKNNIKK